MSISAVNAKSQIKGTVGRIQTNEFVAEVELNTPAGVVTSVVTTRTLSRLGLQVGSEAIAVVMATDVSLETPVPQRLAIPCEEP